MQRRERIVYPLKRYKTTGRKWIVVATKLARRLNRERRTASPTYDLDLVNFHALKISMIRDI
jgi:hypothetical protein